MDCGWVGTGWGQVAIALELGGLLAICLWVMGGLLAHYSQPWFAWVFVGAIAAAGCYILAIAPRLTGRLAVPERGIVGWREGVIRRDNLAPAALHTGLFTLLTTVVIVGWCWWRDPGFLGRLNTWAFLVKLATYLICAAIQGWVFWEFGARRVRAILASAGRDTGMCLGAIMTVLVGALHLPNWRLAALSGIAAMAWGWIYHRNPNLLPIILSHAWLGTLLHRLTPLSFRVGYFYSYPEGRVLAVLWPALNAYLRQLWGRP